MRIHRPRLITKICARAHCGRSFHPWRKTQACCSKSCARKHSPKFQEHLRRVSTIGARRAGAAKHRASQALWIARSEGMPLPLVAKTNYRRGYKAGLAAKVRAAFARGYQQALDDAIEAARLENGDTRGSLRTANG